MTDVIGDVRLPKRNHKTRTDAVDLVGARRTTRKHRVGFSLSIFNRIRAPFAGTMLRRANSDVLPMHLRTSRGI